MSFIRSLAAAGLLLGASAASAHDYKAGDVEIGHPWSRATVPGAKVGGAFLTLTNKGRTADRLLGVSVDFAARAEIHESSEEGGIARMRQIEGGVEIKPGETVEFAPGGKHLMFIGLKVPLTKGERVKGELEFEKAGKVPVDFTVEAAGAKPEKQMDHSGH